MKTMRATTLYLEGVPAAGYEWLVSNSDNCVVTRQPNINTPPRDAIGGAVAFAFLIEWDGEASATFRYQRPWETTHANEFQITLR